MGRRAHTQSSGKGIQKVQTRIQKLEVLRQSECRTLQRTAIDTVTGTVTGNTVYQYIAPQSQSQHQREDARFLLDETVNIHLYKGYIVDYSHPADVRVYLAYYDTDSNTYTVEKELISKLPSDSA